MFEGTLFANRSHNDMSDSSWEHFAHSADIGIRGRAETIGEAFEEAALALTSVITSLDKVEPLKEISIQCENTDTELLLADWINEIIYQMAAKRMLFSRFQVTIDGPLLRGKAWGEPLDIAKHEPAVEVKGATFTDLKVAQIDGKWLAQCIVDV